MYWRMQKLIDDVNRTAVERTNRRAVCKRIDRPIISFSFDDFPRSAYLGGGKILEDYGARGTFYLSAGLLNTKTEVGPTCGPADVGELIAKGHELGCHTFEHLLSRSHSKRDYEASIRKNQECINGILPGYVLRTFSYPGGSVTANAKLVAGARFECARSTLGGFNSGEFDALLLKANRLYSRKMQLSHVERYLDKGCEENAWIIFYTHDVTENPSEYGCESGFLRNVVKRAVDSGADILPVLAAYRTVTGHLHAGGGT
jgi:peptidoglycan/xylan/chitin deacetylase (PgdA/CDA1 family)